MCDKVRYDKKKLDVKKLWRRPPTRRAEAHANMMKAAPLPLGKSCKELYGQG